jgi:hypothetical protein
MHTNGIIISTYIKNNTKQVQQNQMESQESRQRELKQIHFLARDKVIKSNSQCKDDK